MNNKMHNPDILYCLANISNDEVFTSPHIVNQILDILPPELFSNSNAKFLDPCTKSGVFLREIIKRLIIGLANQIPDLKKRIEHILKNQIYGISITELTSLLSRRSIYCSKIANNSYSIFKFNNKQGNIRYKKTQHKWNKNGTSCIYCGANIKEFSNDNIEKKELYAYEFIHTNKPEEIFNMKFDVIIGNPPYQLNDGGGTGSSAKPIYNLFVEQALKLNPKYLAMIIPARWYSGGRGLENFRYKMLKNKSIKELHDFPNAIDCFPDVEIKGGVCYFLYDRNYSGDCLVYEHVGDKVISKVKRPLIDMGLDTFIRSNKFIEIIKKIRSFNELSFSTIVSSNRPFGFRSNFNEFTKKEDIKIYTNNGIKFIDSKTKIPRGSALIKKWKILIPKAIGKGDVASDKIKIIISEPNSICTETYLVIGPFSSRYQAENAGKYIQTKFFHLFLSFKKITQNSSKDAYDFIPLQNFDENLDDKKLYKKYNLTEKEISLIEETVWSERKK